MIQGEQLTPEMYFNFNTFFEQFDNTGIISLECQPDGRWRYLKWHDVSHLDGLS